MAELPGVEFTYSMNQQVTINMQGFGGMSVLFLIDGERMAGETLDNIDFQRLNIDDIERVEVVKGAASALYGSNSVGALVNIITKSHSEPWQAHLDAHVGSRNGEQRYGGSFSFNNKKWTNFLNMQQSSFDSYKVYDKGRSDSTQIFGSRQYNIKDKLIYAINERQKLTARGGYYFRERNTSPDDKDRAKDASAGLKYTADIGQADNLEISYTFDRYDKSDYYPSTGDDIMDYRNMQNSLRALYVRHFDDSFSLTFGGDGMVDYLKSYQFQEDESHSQTTADLFVQSDWEIGKHWELIGGLRTDYFSKYGWELTPKISAMYRVGEFRLRGGYAKGFRTPTLKEMYMNFNMADIFNIYGNTDLESEKTHSFSASAEYSWGSYNAVVSGYYNLIDNEISTIWDASLDDGRGAMHYVNVGGTNLASADATITARYPFGLGWKLSYAFFHEFTRNDAPNTSDSRPHSLTWQASYHQKYRKYYWELTFNGRYLSDADFYTYNSGSYTSYVKTHSPGYQVWRLSLMQRFWKGITLTAAVDNIFNYKPDQYQYNSLFTKGTTLLFTLAVDIEKFFNK